MKGKRLFQLIDTIDASEGKILINVCKSSKDKRHQYLHEVLSKRPYENIEKLNEKVDKFFSKQGKLSPQADKSVRRFIDFACKEIENIKLDKWIKEDELTRSMLLSKNFMGGNQVYLTDYYLDKAFTESERRKDQVSQSICLEYYITSFSKQQTVKAVSKIKKLTEQKFNFISDLYHKNQSEYYNIVSNMYIDDADFTKNAILPTESRFMELVTETKGSIYSIVYELSLARLKFTEEETFKVHIENCEKQIQNAEGRNEEKQKWFRRVLFTKASVGFHFGWNNNMLLQTLKRLLDYNEAYKYYDDASCFYYLLLMILSGKNEQVNKYLHQPKLPYFKNEDNEMLGLIKALLYYKEEDFKQFRIQVSELSHCQNYYINGWAKLLEILYWIKKGDEDFAFNLLGRAERFFQKNKNKHFCMKDNLLTLKAFKISFKKSKGAELNKLGTQLQCEFYKWIFEQLA